MGYLYPTLLKEGYIMGYFCNDRNRSLVLLQRINVYLFLVCSILRQQLISTLYLNLSIPFYLYRRNFILFHIR